jgi:molybdate transport system substrate-binding protein
LRATLIAARRVVIVDPSKGTSGRLMMGMFRFLGLEDEMRDKLLRIDGGMVTEAVARGDADLGFQQVSEILPVAGVELAGTLPGTLKKLTRYDLAVVSGGAHRDEADALARELTSDAARAVIRASGFTDAR